MNFKERWPFALIAAFFILFAAWVSYSEVMVVKSKYAKDATISTGSEALAWALFLFCVGMAHLGPLCGRKVAVVVSWMSVWMIAGVLAVLVPAYLH